MVTWNGRVRSGGGGGGGGGGGAFFVNVVQLVSYCDLLKHVGYQNPNQIMIDDAGSVQLLIFQSEALGHTWKPGHSLHHSLKNRSGETVKPSKPHNMST